MDADLSQRNLLEQDLRKAIENDGLKVVYQPFMNANGETVVGWRRWRAGRTRCAA